MLRFDFQWLRGLSGMGRAAVRALYPLKRGSGILLRKAFPRRHPPVLQEQRVWDLVNAGSNHRFLLQGAIVSQCNFGLLYGQAPPGLKAFSEANYGVKMSLEQAEEFSNKFFSLYSRLPVYHTNYKAFAKKYGHVRSPLGRIRHLPLANSPNRMVASGVERQAINSAVQSTLSDMLLWALAIEDKEGLLEIAPAFGAVHDASYHYIPEDRVDDLVQRQLDILENLPFHLVGWAPQLKFLADAKVGPNMAQLSKWKPSK